MTTTRFHITDGNRRTTITMDTIVSKYVAVALGEEPESREAHSAIARFLSERLTERLGPLHNWQRTSVNPGLSSYALEEALSLIVRPDILISE